MSVARNGEGKWSERGEREGEGGVWVGRKRKEGMIVRNKSERKRSVIGGKGGV